MAKPLIPKLVKQFEKLLWVNTPKNWTLTSVYLQGTLFVSVFVETSPDEEYQKIRRSFTLDVLSDRTSDLWGLAADCIDEMKAELKN